MVRKDFDEEEVRLGIGHEELGRLTGQYKQEIEEVLGLYDKGELTLKRAKQLRRNKAKKLAKAAPLRDGEDEYRGFNVGVYWKLMSSTRRDFTERIFKEEVRKRGAEEAKRIAKDFYLSEEHQESCDLASPFTVLVSPSFSGENIPDWLDDLTDRD